MRRVVLKFVFQQLRKEKIHNMTEKSFVSVLIDSKIIAMKFNENGINDVYIESINSALSELK